MVRPSFMRYDDGDAPHTHKIAKKFSCLLMGSHVCVRPKMKSVRILVFVILKNENGKKTFSCIGVVHKNQCLVFISCKVTNPV